MYSAGFFPSFEHLVFFERYNKQLWKQLAVFCCRIAHTFNKNKQQDKMGPRKMDHEAVQRITKALGPNVS